MTKGANAESALDFVRKHGVVLVSARGAAPRLTEAIIGEPIKSSWWAHPHGHHIYAILSAVTDSVQVLVCRLLDHNITLVHRRLWPALVRLASRFTQEQLAQVEQQHTASGRHLSRETPFPQWVPAEVAAQAARLSEQEALAIFGAWVRPLRSAGK